MKRTLLLPLLIVVTATFVFAHGNEQHVIGTVAKLGTNSITVKTTAGKLVEVAVTPESRLSRAGQKIELTDVKVGDRIVIHASKKDNRLEATTIQLGSATQAASAGVHRH